MAKQIPCAGRMVAVFTPTTRPAESTSGPPELPGFSAASVWIDVVNQPPGIRPQRPPQRADHARRHRRLKSIRSANRNHNLPHAQPLRIAQRRHAQSRLVKVRPLQPDHRQVARRVVSNPRGRHAPPIGHGHRNPHSVVHHVTVRKDQPIRREHESRAAAAPLPAARRSACGPPPDALQYSPPTD